MSSEDTLKLKASETDLVMDTVLRFEIQPTAEQEKKLFDTFYLCRKLYNTALDERVRHYKETGRGLSYRDQQNKLPAFKVENPVYNTVHSQVLQDALRRLDHAFVNFFEKRAGFPRFKDKFRYRSITLPQCDAKRNFGQSGYVYFPKVGQIKLNAHQLFDPVQVKIINIKYQNGKWFVSLTVETTCKPPVREGDRAVGIDLGLTHLITTSEGKKHENPRWIQKSEKRIQKTQRKLSKKKKGSQNRHKAKQQLQKQHDRIVNQRKDYLHKISHNLVQNHDIICMEDLRVKEMMSNHRLAKSIANASWNRLANYLVYKCKRDGKRLVQVDPQYTTQMCCRCKEKVKKALSERMHRCPHCQIEMDRDLNAAINILQAGLRMLA